MPKYQVMREQSIISWSSVEADNEDHANEVAENTEQELSWKITTSDVFFVSYAEGE